MLKKIFYVSILCGFLEAGMLGSVMDYGKDKAKDKLVESAKSKYESGKEERRNFESQNNTKSEITKFEDAASDYKNKNKKEFEESVGRENIDAFNNTKESFKNAFKPNLYK